MKTGWHWHRAAFSINGAGKTIFTCKRMQLDPNLTPYLKINSKWINDLNIRVENTKFLDKNKTKTLMTLHVAILDMTPVAQTTKGKINWTSWKLETFVQQKGYQLSKKTTPRRENISNHVSNKTGDSGGQAGWCVHLLLEHTRDSDMASPSHLRSSGLQDTRVVPVTGAGAGSVAVPPTHAHLQGNLACRVASSSLPSASSPRDTTKTRWSADSVMLAAAPCCQLPQEV